MKNAEGKIIYIGKAKKLKNRVSQYFTGVERHTPKVYAMVEQVEDFDYIVCDSEFEALILECSLIKQNQPKYNIKLKDDTGYSYIRAEKGDWPRITAVRAVADDGAEYIGPYNSYFTVKSTVDEARKIFGLPDCGRVFPRDFGKGRPCLNRSIGNCMGVCSGKISREEYAEAYSSALRFIKGGINASLPELQRDMEAAAEKLDFERAARIRDRIRAIERSRERQKVITSSDARADVVASAKLADTCAVQLFVFRNGRLEDSRGFKFSLPESPEETELAFLRQYYTGGADIPPKIYVDLDSEELPLLARMLSERLGRKAEVTAPKIGENRALVEMCRRNAEELLAKDRPFTGNAVAALDSLARLLGLPSPPEYIEAYDISNHAGKENVGGMVVFLMGEPLKAGYRKFRIKTVAGQDDFRSMAEVLDRRFTEYFAHKGEGEGFGRLPDLILLDGGAPQLAAAKPVPEKYGLDIPMFGLVKDGRHKTDAVAGDGGHIAIKANRAVYTLLSEIQEEVHRYAIGYHRKSARKNALRSALLDIPGIGEKKAATLLKSFKTVAAISSADVESIAALPGISRADAEAVHAAFSGNGAAPGNTPADSPLSDNPASDGLPPDSLPPVNSRSGNPPLGNPPPGNQPLDRLPPDSPPPGNTPPDSPLTDNPSPDIQPFDSSPPGNLPPGNSLSDCLPSSGPPPGKLLPDSPQNGE